MKLINEQGKEIKVGDKVTSFRGYHTTIKSIHPPRHPASSGHITTREGEFLYVTVFNLKFVS